MLAIRRVWLALSAYLSAGGIVDFLSAYQHAPYFTRHRVGAIVARVRLVAAAFSVFTLLWIAFDAATLAAEQWIPLGVLRLLAVAVFVALALAPDKERTRAGALFMLGVMLALPMVLFVVAHFMLGDRVLTGMAAINWRLYEALPFVVLAGLSIFPLVTLEGLLFAMPIMVLVVFAQVAQHGHDFVRLLSSVWIYTLMLGVYLLACAIQIHYMMALLRRASYDPLTGAMTRRSGVEVIDFNFRLSCEQDEPFVVAFIDIDRFKSINDDFGHEAGDTVLREAAAALTHLVRKGDTVVRWGGEEFVVLLPHTDIDGVRIVVERILAEWLGKRPDGSPLTASIGVAERVRDGVEDWPELLRLADERMYAAKQSGRARCIMCDGEVLTPPA